MLKLHIIVLQNRIKEKLGHYECLRKKQLKSYMCILLFVHKIKKYNKTHQYSFE